MNKIIISIKDNKRFKTHFYIDSCSIPNYAKIILQNNSNLINAISTCTDENIIKLLCDEFNIKNKDNQIQISLTYEEGYLCSNGKCKPIT